MAETVKSDGAVEELAAVKSELANALDKLADVSGRLDTANGEVLAMSDKLAAVNGELASLKDAPVVADPHLDARQTEMARLVETSNAALADKDEVIAQLERDIEAAKKGQLDAEKRAAKMVPAPKPVKLRKCGPMAESFDLPSLEELMAADDASFTVVPSDGKAEIASLPNMEVTGDSWLRRISGMILNMKLELLGPPPGEAAPTVAGFGLFDAKGAQIAWAQLSQPVAVPTSQEMRFENLAFN